MMRILLELLFLWMLWKWMLPLLIRGASTQRPMPPPANANSSIPMVRCARCGTYRAQHDCLVAQGAYYCGTACRDGTS